jgi:hypothetical protein
VNAKEDVDLTPPFGANLTIVDQGLSGGGGASVWAFSAGA